MTATLTFFLRSDAEEFASSWSKLTLRGHTIGSGTENVKVTVFDVTDQEKSWIDNYVEFMNKDLD